MGRVLGLGHLGHPFSQAGESGVRGWQLRGPGSCHPVREGSLDWPRSQEAQSQLLGPREPV